MDNVSNNDTTEADSLHVPVLLEQVLQCLQPQDGESYLDLTAGYGGHARAVLERTGNRAQTVLVDRDENAAQVLRKEFPDETVTVRRQDFLTASRELLAEKQRFDLIMADLGVSSPHLNEGKRGFAINSTGPLDMRMDG